MANAAIATQRFPSPRQDWDAAMGNRSFGRRQPHSSANHANATPLRFGGVDRAVPDMRRRIYLSSKRQPARLPLAVCGVAILSSSAAMWANVGYLANHVATTLAGLY
jgi:hypothetical protein